MKFCRDCKYSSKSKFLFWTWVDQFAKCLHPNAKQKGEDGEVIFVDKITGEVVKRTEKETYLYCSTMRKDYAYLDYHCGENARLFEPIKKDD